MNRTLTAAVALAAGLGMAGLAHAQSSAGPSTTPNTMNPSMPSTQMTPPTSAQNPTAMQNPGTMSNPGYGTRPQATSQQYQGQGQYQNPAQGQMNQGMAQDLSQSQIEQAQQQLKSQGLYNGAIDGIVGPETQNALLQYQRGQGLPETAEFDQQTLGRLMGPPSGAAQNMGAATGSQPMTGTTSSSAYPTGTQNPASTTNR
jgi:peptidoglycan hydrolase-like protein with peptidoglycan-binding domain